MPDTTTWRLGNGRYEVKRKLGEGGMAFALLAVDRTTGGDVVVKIPKPAMMADPEFARRFRREIRSMQELDHEHIVKIKDVGEHEGTPYFVMDLLAGGSLQDRFEPAQNGRTKPMPPESLADWLEPVAAALDYLHQRYVHRDIKPANILFDADGNAFVSDFGIVKAIADGPDQTNLTQTGMTIGTCAYMAPELSEGKKVDGRVDQYALAVTAYQTLGGRVPFDGASFKAVIIQQIRGEFTPLRQLVPALPPALAQAVEKALSEDRERRYSTCTAFAKAVLATLTTAKRGERQATAVCPACRTRFALPPNPERKNVKCSRCGAGFMVTKKGAKRQPAHGVATSRLSVDDTHEASIPLARLADPINPSSSKKSGAQAALTSRVLACLAAGIIVSLLAASLLVYVWNPTEKNKRVAAKQDSNESLAKGLQDAPAKMKGQVPTEKKDSVPNLGKKIVEEPKKLKDDAPIVVDQYTIKLVMKEAMKGGLTKKVSNGQANDDEKRRLVDLFTALSNATPPGGDEASWKGKTIAMLNAAKAGDGDALKKATNCAACHKEHKK